MDFIEEKTPRGYLIKILFKNWQYLAFGKKGQSIYADKEGKSMLHRVPLIIFVGENFDIKKNYLREYTLLKVRNNTMILPYNYVNDKEVKYIFIVTDLELDAVPVRLASTKNVATMVKEMEATIRPDYIIVDETVTSNDVIIIKNRYSVENVIYIEETHHYKLTEMSNTTTREIEQNINVLSQNPVFLARIHLRNMNLSKINQLLLDFDLTALDTEYIMNFITTLLNDKGKPLSPKNRAIMNDLIISFQFYHYLLKKDDENINTLIDSQTRLSNVATFRTLISKVKSMHPGNEEQLLYTEYDNHLLQKREELQSK